MLRYLSLFTHFLHFPEDVQMHIKVPAQSPTEGKHRHHILTLLDTALFSTHMFKAHILRHFAD